MKYINLLFLFSILFACKKTQNLNKNSSDLITGAEKTEEVVKASDIQGMSAEQEQKMLNEQVEEHTRQAEQVEQEDLKVKFTPDDEPLNNPGKPVSTKNTETVQLELGTDTNADLKDIAKKVSQQAKQNADQRDKIESQKIESALKNETSKIEAPKTEQEKILVPNPPVKAQKMKPMEKPGAFSHSLFSDLLSQHVSKTGFVDYGSFKKDEGKLDSYINSLQQNFIKDDWSKAEKLAYWINVYNAFTIKLILKNYPLKKITDLESGKPWDKSWIELGGKTYSLNDIENEVIRPTFMEPRIHFAVNCAAQSCPPLMNKAWNAQNLEIELERRAKSFINNKKYNDLNESSASISKIFEWYKGDFGELVEYLNKYANSRLTSDARINYMEYDWSLNGK